MDKSWGWIWMMKPLTAARERLTGFGDRLYASPGEFRGSQGDLEGDRLAVEWMVLFWIWVSRLTSSNLESGAFSFRGKARLDMRMDRRQSLDAYQIVNTFSAPELGRILRQYGEEPQARRIALSYRVRTEDEDHRNHRRAR